MWRCMVRMTTRATTSGRGRKPAALRVAVPAHRRGHPEASRRRGERLGAGIAPPAVEGAAGPQVRVAVGAQAAVKAELVKPKVKHEPASAIKAEVKGEPLASGASTVKLQRSRASPRLHMPAP